MLKRNISGIRKNSGSFPSSDYPAHSWTNILKKYSGIDYKPQHQCGVSALPKGQSTTSITLTYNKTRSVQNTTSCCVHTSNKPRTTLNHLIHINGKPNHQNRKNTALTMIIYGNTIRMTSL